MDSGLNLAQEVAGAPGAILRGPGPSPTLPKARSAFDDARARSMEGLQDSVPALMTTSHQYRDIPGELRR
jgi:hypothetical protein